MPRFPWKVFRRVILIQALLILAAIAASALTARYFFKRQFVAQVETQLRDTLQALDSDLPPGRSMAAGHAQGWCQGHARSTSFRFTVIRPDGALVCDSQIDPDQAENHRDRPEVQAALQEGFGQAQRHSRSTDADMLYGALWLPSKELVLRAAYPLSKLNQSLQVLDASIVAFLVLIAAALGLFAIWSGRMLVFPIGRLLLKTQGVLQGGAPAASASELLQEESYGEWSELESSIDDIRRDLIAKAESLNLEREELATLMGAISDAILAVDLEGKPLFFNTRFAVLFRDQPGLASKGIRLWEMFRAPEILEPFRLALDQGRAGEAQAVSIEQGDGGKRFFSVSVSPLRKGGGAVYGAVGIFHDVTELKSAEQIRIDFVANVSHELRTPLTSIKGYTDTLLLDLREGRPASREFLEIIHRNVERLMNLIRDLLDLSSLESTDLIHRAPVSTAEVTSRVVGQFHDALDRKRQRVATAYDAPVVLADPRRLEQVLTNLLENAAKYTPAGSEIRVGWEQERDSVLLRVSDNGPGIPPEHHARLFERFYRVDKARSRDQGGTGLGLAIVKHIMQRHNGSVWIESAPGRGAAFVCRFPG